MKQTVDDALGENLSVGITPYEKRYRSVYDAGGIKFYPEIPSVALQKFLKEHNSLHGLAVIMGCGEGRNVKPLARSGWRVIGIDSSASALKKAQENYKGNLSVKLIHADVLDELNILDSSVDLVVVVQLLHLLIFRKDRRKLYKNIYCKLRSGGIVFFENNGCLNKAKPERLAGKTAELRTIQTNQGPRRIPLDRLPTIVLDGKTLRRELESGGLFIDEMKSGLFKHPDTWREQIIVVARKP